MTGDLADLAGKTAAQAAAVLRNGRRAVPKALSGQMRGRLRRALEELAVTIERTWHDHHANPDPGWAGADAGRSDAPGQPA